MYALVGPEIITVVDKMLLTNSAAAITIEYFELSSFQAQ